MSKLNKIKGSEFESKATLEAQGDGSLIVKNAFSSVDASGNKRFYSVVVRQNGCNLSSRAPETALIGDIQKLMAETANKLKKSLDQIAKIEISKESIKAHSDQKVHQIKKTKTNQRVFRKIGLLSAIDEEDKKAIQMCLDEFDRKRTKQLTVLDEDPKNGFAFKMQKVQDTGNTNSLLFNQKNHYSTIVEALRLGADPKVLRAKPSLKIQIIAALVATVASMILLPFLPGILSGFIIATSIIALIYAIRNFVKDKKAKADLKNTLSGIYLGTQPIENDRSTIKFSGDIKKFFENSSGFETTEKYARNSPTTLGATTSSYNRIADTTTNLRQVTTTSIAEDPNKHSSDYYTGRVHDLKTATELSKFLFSCELEKDPSAQKGIKKINENKYEFTFAVQSLLSMINFWDEGGQKMFAKEQEAYLQLMQKDSIEMQDPRDSSKTIFVKMKPMIVGATNYNFTEKVQGQNRKSREISKQSCKQLKEYHKTIKTTLSDDTNKKIEKTFELLEKEKEFNYKEVMYRAYLCHLLNIPEVIHCKSSVDRTNLAGAMITAMKQFILSGKELPEDICQIIEMKENGQEPFKELFFRNLLRGQAIALNARGAPGYKLNTHIPLLGDRLASPALLRLMPERLLQNGKLNLKHPDIVKSRLFHDNPQKLIRHI